MVVNRNPGASYCQFSCRIGLETGDDSVGLVAVIVNGRFQRQQV